jgi:hypothetical protein
MHPSASLIMDRARLGWTAHTPLGLLDFEAAAARRSSAITCVERAAILQDYLRAARLHTDSLILSATDSQPSVQESARL